MGGNTVSNEIHFYISKTKIFISFLCVIFLNFLGVICILSGNLFYVLVGIFGLIFFSLGFIIFLMSKFNPHLTLTELELIIMPRSKRALHIRWEDIEEIQLSHLMVQDKKGAKMIFIDVYDEDKYAAHMSTFSKILMLISKSQSYYPFSISWFLIQSKDRKKLIEELNRRAINSKTKINIEDV